MTKSSHASAPGKIILFGEHAVVYGRPAIAAPVADVRATARLEPGPAGSGFRIKALDLGRDYQPGPAATDDPLATIVQHTLRRVGQTLPLDLTLTVTSTIPLGRGLGSGAAISTAIARAIAAFFEVDLSAGEVSALVFEVEKLYHGTPSGIDNTVIAFEQPVYFIKDHPLRRMRVAEPFTLLVGDTGVSAATWQVVGDLRRRWQAEPRRYEGYFDEIGVLVRQARLLIEQGVQHVSALGKLMNENQEVLAAMGLSSAELDRLVEAARQAGAWGAKLSGAGWGGNMIALAPSDLETVDRMEQALRQAGAVNVMATLVSETQSPR